MLPTANEQDEREDFEKFILSIKLWDAPKNFEYVSCWYLPLLTWQHQQSRIDVLKAKLDYKHSFLLLCGEDAENFANKIESLQAQLDISNKTLKEQQENSNKLRCFLWNNAKSQSAYEKMTALADLVTDGITEAINQINKLQGKG